MTNKTEFIRIYSYTEKKDGRPYDPPYGMIYAKTEAQAEVIAAALRNAEYKNVRVRLSHGTQWHVDAEWK